VKCVVYRANGVRKVSRFSQSANCWIFNTWTSRTLGPQGAIEIRAYAFAYEMICRAEFYDEAIQPSLFGGVLLNCFAAACRRGRLRGPMVRNDRAVRWSPRDELRKTLRSSPPPSLEYTCSIGRIVPLRRLGAAVSQSMH